MLRSSVVWGRLHPTQLLSWPTVLANDRFNVYLYTLYNDLIFGFSLIPAKNQGAE